MLNYSSKIMIVSKSMKLGMTDEKEAWLARKEIPQRSHFFSRKLSFISIDIFLYKTQSIYNKNTTTDLRFSQTAINCYTLLKRLWEHNIIKMNIIIKTRNRNKCSTLNFLVIEFGSYKGLDKISTISVYLLQSNQSLYI